MPTESPRFSARRSCAIILIACVFLYLLFLHSTPPFRQLVAQRFIVRGDRYFIALHYDEAEREYLKAEQADAQSAAATDRLRLVRLAETDIVNARSFFEDHHVDNVVRKIDEATAQHSTPKEALTAGIALYQSGDYGYARYPLEEAVQLDPKYPEAWHYLALTYDKLAEVNASYRDKAKDARAKRDALSPAWLGM